MGVQHSETVQITTLDALTQERPVRFLKVDVEGAERSVLAGGSTLISQDRPTILVEHSPATSGSEDPSLAPDAWTFLGNLGYVMCRDDGTELTEPPNGIVNILAIPSLR